MGSSCSTGKKQSKYQIAASGGDADGKKAGDAPTAPVRKRSSLCETDESAQTRRASLSHIQKLKRKGECLTRDELQETYSFIPPELFNSIWGLFDWKSEDTRGDGGVSMAKRFALVADSLMSGPAKSAKDEVRRGFVIFDTNGDGTLTKADFHIMFHAAFSTRQNATRMIMKSEGGRATLLEYAKAEFSDENIEFINQAEAWAIAPAEERTLERATQISNQFINEGAEAQINLSNQVRKQTVRKLRNSAPAKPNFGGGSLVPGSAVSTLDPPANSAKTKEETKEESTPATNPLPEGSHEPVVVCANASQSMIRRASMANEAASKAAAKAAHEAVAAAGANSDGADATAATGGLDPKMFDSAVDQIYKLIEKDMFARFRKQDEQMSELVDKIFHEVDGNGDGLLQFEEFEAWVQSAPDVLSFLTDLYGKSADLQKQAMGATSSFSRANSSSASVDASATARVPDDRLTGQ